MFYLLCSEVLLYLISVLKLGKIIQQVSVHKLTRIASRRYLVISLYKQKKDI